MLAVTVIGMTIAGAASFLFERSQALGQVDERLDADAHAVHAYLTGESDVPTGNRVSPPALDPPGFTDPSEALQDAISRILPGRNEATVAVVDGHPRWVPAVPTAFDLSEDDDFIDRVVAEVDQGERSLKGTALTLQGPVRYIAVPVTVRDHDSGGIFVAAIDLDAELAPAYASLRIYLWCSLGAIALIGVAGWFVAGRVLAPIRHLREAASRITVTDLSERIPVRADDDLSVLTATMNEMFDRLQASHDASGQLLADVRHELMTPITIVRGHLELLNSAERAEVDATRELAIDELDRMTELVRDIEILTTAEDGGRLRWAATDIGELTAEIHSKVRGWTGHAWDLVDTAQLVVPGDGARLTQAWLQLADNARKYSPAGTTIRIGSTRMDGNVALWVSDEGPGIPVDIQHGIFDRFRRVDPHGRGTSGSGLGLAIVSAIGQAHGGRAQLESSPAGSTFSIIIPAVDHSTRSST